MPKDLHVDPSDVSGPAAPYEPPALTHLGNLAELTLLNKTVGGADGSTFLGVDIS